MPVKLRALLHGDEQAGVSRSYVLEIHGTTDHGVAVLGPADARDLIAEGRALFDSMEQQLELAGTIDAAVMAKIAAPHPTAVEETTPPGGDALPGGASAHGQGEGQQLNDETGAQGPAPGPRR